MIFWLGTHVTQWLGKTDVPLFLSRRRLALVKKSPRALGPWALDSGGFSELNLFGRWTISAKQYVAEVRRWRDDIGNLQWAAIQDWMCEPWVLSKTGLTVQEHQQRTIASYIKLRALAPEIPWVPVLQGWEEEDYLRHLEDYAAAGVSLATLPLVGVGSVCRRQGTLFAARLIRYLVLRHALRLHGFGFKITGLRRVANLLISADSLAWSFTARRERLRLPGCSHSNCANCLLWALQWRERVLETIPFSEIDSA